MADFVDPFESVQPATNDPQTCTVNERADERTAAGEKLKNYQAREPFANPFHRKSLKTEC